MFEFNFTENFNDIIMRGAISRLTDAEFIEKEIARFLQSKRRMEMISGDRYYRGDHDILRRERQVIGADGKLQKVDNLPNNRVVDNQYRKMVTQKVNYLLGQPITVQSDNKNYADAISEYLNKRFMRLIKNIGHDSLNGGIGWVFVHYDEDGQLSFKRIKPHEIIAGWKDDDHTILDYAIRLYEVITFEGKNEKVAQKVEVYEENGIHRFILDDDGRLKPDYDTIQQEAYFTLTDGDIVQGYNWQRIPLIPFKFNNDEIPLIRNIKSLQDGLNLILSNFENSMEEDARNTILVLVNYDGENLAEFRHNLAEFGVVPIKTVDGAAGDLRTLQIEVNAENYKTIIEIFKKAIIENAMGYDAKDDRLGANANQLNIKSMYSDIDLDANEMETEYQASFEELIYFIDIHLSNIGAGDFEGEQLDVIFNRDMMISESEIINNLKNSVGILSDETIVTQHPWVDNPQLEMERKKNEADQSLLKYEFSNPLVTYQPAAY